jgi:hypothetical protein
MSNLIPYDQDRPVMRRAEARQLSRSLGSLRTHSRLEMARIEAAAEVQATRADAVTYVGRRAMQDVAMLSQLEQQLATLVPMASGRLAAIGDIASIAIAEVVSDTLRRVR